MAKPTKPVKKTSSKPSMRDLAAAGKAPKKRSLKRQGSLLARPFKRLKPSGKKRRKLINLPDNRAGRILDAILFTVPRYFKAAWGEIRQTTWPNRKETIRLTFAVFVFSTIFAVFIAVLDFVLDKVFKNLIIK